MKRLRGAAAVALACAAVIAFLGCGGGGASNITITLTTTNGLLTVDESQMGVNPAPTLVFMAAVGGDTKNQGVTWELDKQSNCSGTGTAAGQCGSLTNQQVVNGESQVTYTPPTGLTASKAITLTAKSVTNPKVMQTATITVELPPTFTLTGCNPPSPPAGSPCVLPEGKNGVPYTSSGSTQVTIAFSGGVSPYQVTTTSATNPTLPSLCLSVTSSTTSTNATVSGTPCGPAAGMQAVTITFTVTVTDSGGSPPVGQTFSIKIDPPPPLSIITTSLPPGTTNVQYASAVVIQGGVAPYKWTMTPAPTFPPGLAFHTSTGQISGVPTTPGVYNFTVQVQDSTLPTDQVAPASPLALSITIQAPTKLQITNACPAPPAVCLLQGGITATGYSAGLQASGGVPPYNWSVIQGQLPAGLKLATQADSSGLISGTPILVGTSTFTIQVADSELPPGTQTATVPFQIQVTANPNTGSGANNSLLQGSYAYLFTGFDLTNKSGSGGSVLIAGTIAADGKGTITSGTQDENRASGVKLGESVTGSYSIGPDGRGTLELISTFANQASLTADYRLVLDSSGGAHFFQDDSTATSTDKTTGADTHGEGVLKPVVGNFGTASFAGNYAFVFPGQDLAGKPAALGGVIKADGAGGLASTSNTSDFNDAGTFSSGSLSGTFSVTSGSNRGQASLTFPLPNGQTTLTFSFFFVTPSDLFFVEADASQMTGLPTMDRLAGEMILQSPNVVFDSTALGGESVASGIGVNGSGNSDVFAGLLTAGACDGSTQRTLSYDENSGGTVTSPSHSGTCTMGLNGNGRASFNFTGLAAAQTRLATAYLTGKGTGFLLGSDAAVTTGMLEQQAGTGNISDTSVEGTYALSAPTIEETQQKSVIGQVSADGAGDFISTDAGGNKVSVVDESDPPATSSPTLDQLLSANLMSLAVSGRGTLTTTAPVPNGFPTNAVLYVVSPSSLRMISTDSTDQHPNLFRFDH